MCRRRHVGFDTGNANAWLTVYCKSVVEVSDARAKTNVAAIENALDRVSKLRGVSYRFRGEGARPADPKRLGLIAQEVAAVVPEAAHAEGRQGGISYSMLVPLLVEAIKELKTEVDDLRKEVRRMAGAEPAPQSPKSRSRKTRDR